MSLYDHRFDEPIGCAKLTPEEQQAHDEYVDRQLREMLEEDGISEEDDPDDDDDASSESAD